MSYSTDPSARASFIGDLRALADFLDRAPGRPRPPVRRVTSPCTPPAPTTADVVRSTTSPACSAPPSPTTPPAAAIYRAERAFGQITYSVVSIPEAHMAAYHALNSYDGCVSPDTP